MKNKLRILQSVSLVLIIMAAVTCSYAGIGSSSGSFLRINPTARSSSLGNAYTALSDDLECLSMNPGGLYQLKTPQLSFLHMVYMEGGALEYTAFGLPLPNNAGVLAVRIEYLTSGDIDRTIEFITGTDYSISGSFNTSELLAGVSYGTMLGKFGVGINCNFLLENLDTVSGSGMTFDLGVHYIFNGEIKAGLSAQNIGLLKLGNGNYPLIIRGGVVVAQKIESFPVKFLADAVYDTEASILRGGLGVEGDVFGVVLVRLGYELGYDLGGFTAGLGYGFNAMGERLELNYAMVPRGDFGLTHKFSLTVKFGENKLPVESKKIETIKPETTVDMMLVPIPEKVNTAEPEKKEAPVVPVLKEVKQEVTAEQIKPKKIRRIIKKKKMEDGSTTYTTIYPDGQPVQSGE